MIAGEMKPTEKNSDDTVPITSTNQLEYFSKLTSDFDHSHDHQHNLIHGQNFDSVIRSSDDSKKVKFGLEAWFEDICLGMFQQNLPIPFISLWNCGEGENQTQPLTRSTCFLQPYGPQKDAEQARRQMLQMPVVFNHGEIIHAKDPLFIRLSRETRNLLFASLPADLKAQTKIVPQGSESVLLVPIRYEGLVVGAWCLASPKRAQWNHDDAAFFEALATHYQSIRAQILKPQHTTESKGSSHTPESAPKVSSGVVAESSSAASKSPASTKPTKTYEVVGTSKPIQDILSMIDRVAPTTASILILGESGTGKENLARRLHLKSTRTSGAYVTVNCAALMESLLESELFGHEKGSFTGAVAQKLGLCEIADGGTLFLDEIGEMSPGIQTKMLRFLQEGEFYRIGGKKPIHVSVRIVAATNRDLAKEVIEGRFREDLYYRLNTISLKIPPLRERKSDIPELAKYFLVNSKYSDPNTQKKFSPEVLEKLADYSWPGNIRELQNTVERMRILSEGNEITLSDVPEFIFLNKPNGQLSSVSHSLTSKETGASPSSMPWAEDRLENIEKNHILKTFEKYQGNKTKTAQSLGITIKTLYNKLNRYGLHNSISSTNDSPTDPFDSKFE